MSQLIRREIPLIIFAFCAFFIFYEYFIPIPGGSTVTNYLTMWTVAISNFALALGAYNLIRWHGNTIIKRVKGEWYHSTLILVSLLAMFLSGFFYQPVYVWLYNNLYTYLDVALMCFVGFYFYSAMYRTFKIRNIEAVIVIVSAIFMLLTNAPIGGAIWTGIPIIGNWISNTPGMGGWRGFILSASLAMFAMAVRAGLGLERAYIGEVGGGKK